MTEPDVVDVVILGTGPAGLQAAIHAARKKVSVLVLGKETDSSLFHAHVENFCCIFNITGEDMLSTGRKQAASFGAELLVEDVLEIAHAAGEFSIATESGRSIRTASLVVATGTHRNRLGVPGEKQFIGRGVSYCVDCDANFFKGEDVAVIGEGSAAADGALSLLEVARCVHLISEKLDVAEALRRELHESEVRLRRGQKVKEIKGGNSTEAVVLADGTEIAVSGVFIELGAKGVMELASHLGIQLDDEMKYIATDKKMETNVPGVFAAGDICGPPWQMAKAVGEGCVAGIGAATYAKKLRRAKKD
jgi:thioredoxin reductase (NADPH)